MSLQQWNASDLANVFTEYRSFWPRIGISDPDFPLLALLMLSYTGFLEVNWRSSTWLVTVFLPA